MKYILGLSFLCLLLAVAANAQTVKLPDACGDDSIGFEITTLKGQPAPAPPPSGKAQVIFLENENSPVDLFTYATIRFGMDGTWLGATRRTSYFATTMDPGIHHLCASWQSNAQDGVHLTSFTAESGKVYYFLASVRVESRYSIHFGLKQLNEDEGKYQVTLSDLATPKPATSKHKK